MDGLKSRIKKRLAGVASLVLPMVAIVAIGVSSCSLSDAPSKAKEPAQTEAAAKAAASKPASDTPSRAALQDLAVREEQGQTILQVKFAQPVTQYRHFTLPQPARIVLDVLNNMKAEDASEIFRIDTNLVSTLRLSVKDSNLRLVVEVAAATVPSYTISQDDGGLRIVVGNLNPNVNAKRNMVIVQGGQRVDSRQAAAIVNADTRSQAATTDDQLTGKKTYSGQKISLDFKDADIKNVFRLLAEVSGLNIVVTNDVNRRVTLRLVEVPWDQAMDLIIATNGLDKEQIGNVVRISTANTLKAEKDALIAAQKAKQDLEPMQTVYFTLNYAKAKDLESKIRPLMSKRTDNALVIDERSNTVMVRDIQKSIDDVSTLVGKFDSRTPQILIESNLVETTPSFSRSLGMELDGLFNNNRVLTSSRFVAGQPFVGAAAGALPILPIPTSGFRFGYFANNVRAILSAAESEGQIKIISR
ncbi:MAG: secretin N-terminal domain-containing protein, partial [Chloroflexota bacterium]